MAFKTAAKQRYHVTISQKSDGYMTIYVNGEQIANAESKSRKEFKKVEIWASDDYYNGIENLGEIDILVVSDTIPKSGKIFRLNSGQCD